MPEELLANLDAERGFLSALAWASQQDPAHARRLLDESLVVPERMFLPAHREVLASMTRAFDAGKPTDAVTIGVELKGSKALAEAGGIPWLTSILGSDAFEHQVPGFADAIRAMALRRMLVGIARELDGRARDLEHDAAAAMAEATSKLSGITLTRRTLRTLAEVMPEIVDEMEDAQAGRKRTVSTGFRALDSWIGGWQPTLCVIGAMPGVGKSALLASTVQAMAREGRKVGVFSLEDEARWLGWRFLADESDVSQFYMRNKPLLEGEMRKVTEAVEKMRQYWSNVIIDDRSALSPREVVQTARDMIVNRRCEAIIVDHLGELRYDNTHGDRYDLELMEGLTDLREIAKRHHLPVIIAAHLKRRQGLKQSDEPQLTDFANSSAIERQARLALGLAREPDSDTLTVHVLKQTNGRAGVKFELRFHGAAAMVRDCEGETGQDHYSNWQDGGDR